MAVPPVGHKTIGMTRPIEVSRVKLITIRQSAWFDNASLKSAVEKALQSHGIAITDNLLFRGVPRSRKNIFLKNGTDYAPYRTVMATPHLDRDHEEESDAALFYAMGHDKGRP